MVKKIENVTHEERHFLKLEAGSLNIHLNSVHNCKKDHESDSSGKSFSQAEDLKKHINAFHNGQKYQTKNNIVKLLLLGSEI